VCAWRAGPDFVLGREYEVGRENEKGNYELVS